MALGRAGLRDIRARIVSQPFLLAGICLIAWSLPAMSAADYLSELNAEAQKVETPPVVVEPGEQPAGKSDPASGVTDDTQPGASREKFEALLKKRYLGSYGFYRRLPERSREEVFEEYRQGADMDQLRRKIVNRLLQR
jgi:hypothetical protein